MGVNGRGDDHEGQTPAVFGARVPKSPGILSLGYEGSRVCSTRICCPATSGPQAKGSRDEKLGLVGNGTCLIVIV